ncbi:MAG: 8-amino-7-oxononanoate synthase, partial [Candidatus Omnitrophica bacterium]|nr:8-amino-7-oxononanoate synthase [Candidatus Omnitrophota bacterium]
MDNGITPHMAERKAKGLLRELAVVERLPGGKLMSGGREFFDLSSNDYLGLSFHPALKEAAFGKISRAFGSGASRLMTGTSGCHADLESAVASLKGKEAALIFNSGYQANVGVISALMGKYDAVFADRLSHASIIDGVKLSGARLFRFRHNDTEHLSGMLRAKRPGVRRAMIVTESVFSMDGDVAPLEELTGLKKEHDAFLMVDEAHATGVFGPEGEGRVHSEGLADNVDILMGTFSKALGSFGGYVAVSGEMKEYLINFSRSFIYSTALPPAVIAANLKAIELVKNLHDRRSKLLSLAGYLRQGLKSLGFEVLGESQIVPVLAGTNEAAMKMSWDLREKGFWA